MAVDTKRVKGRRKLHFDSYPQLLSEARMLSRVRTRQLGNWSLDQILEHLAKAMDMAIDGSFRPAWYVRLIGPLLKKRMLAGPIPTGFQIPKNGAHLLPAPVACGDGLVALEKAVARLQENPVRVPHGVFGEMTHAEWDQIQFRHAEMHLGFIVPED